MCIEKILLLQNYFFFQSLQKKNSLPFCWNHKHWWKVPDEDDGENSACTSIDWYCNSSNLSDVSCGSGQPNIREPFTTTCVEHDDIVISCDVTSRSPRKYGVTVHEHGRLILEKSM